MSNKNILTTICCVLAVGIISFAARAVNAQQNFNGRELPSVARVAMGGEEYSGLQFLTVKSKRFVNVAPIVGAGFGAGATSGVEVKFSMTDYQGTAESSSKKNAATIAKRTV